jgi:hypothetical protein
MTFGSIDLTMDTLKVSKDPSASEIRVVLTTNPPDKASSGVTVSGTVVGLPEGASATPHWVALLIEGRINMSANAPFGQRIAQTTPAPDGTFAIRHVLPGNYVANVLIPGSPTGPGTTVVVGDRDVSGLQLSPPLPLTSCSGGTTSGGTTAATIEEKLPGVWIWRSQLSYWGGVLRPADRNLKVTFNKDHTYVIEEGSSVFDRGTWQVGRGLVSVSGSASRYFQGLVAFCDKQVGFDSTYRDLSVYTWERQ